MNSARGTKSQETRYAKKAARLERLAKGAKRCLDHQRLMCRLQDLPAGAGDRFDSTGLDPAIEHEAEDLEGREIPDETTKAFNDENPIRPL